MNRENRKPLRVFVLNYVNNRIRKNQLDVTGIDVYVNNPDAIAVQKLPKMMD